MAVNKIVINNETVLDLTGDTVTADKLAYGYTAHDASGAKISGGKFVEAGIVSAGNSGKSLTILFSAPGIQVETLKVFVARTASTTAGNIIKCGVSVVGSQYFAWATGNAQVTRNNGAHGINFELNGFAPLQKFDGDYYYAVYQ